MVIILVVLKKKRERKENTHMEQQQAHPVLVQLCVLFFFRAKFGKSVECHTKFAASGKLGAEGRNKRVLGVKYKVAKDGGGLKGEKGEEKKRSSPLIHEILDLPPLPPSFPPSVESDTS